MNHSIHHIDITKDDFEEVEWYYERNLSKLQHYAKQLLWWNSRTNLVSRNSSKMIVEEHIRHSITPVIVDNFWKFHHVIDAGTGGGLPGLPLSVVNDDTFFHFVDNNKKKIAALKQIQYDLQLDTEQSHCTSIFNFQPPKKSLFLSKHAFKLFDILNSNLRNRYKEFIFLKGDDYKDELFHVKHPCTVNAYRLDSGTDLTFYHKKYLIHLIPDADEQFNQERG